MTTPSRTEPPQLFDRRLRARRRERSARSFAEAAYLHDAAAEGVVERLAPVLRGFPDAAVFAAADGRYGSALRGRFGIERLAEIEAAPALAERIAALAPTPPIVGDVERSPLAPESVDLVVVGLDLHATNDPVGALIQARRALRPDGLLLACLFCGESLRELREALTVAEAEVLDGLSPRVAPMADLRDLGGLLQRAGFALPVADRDRFTVWQPSALHVMRDLRAMGESNVLTARRRKPTPRRLLLRAGEIYAERFARADGKVPMTVEIAYLAGWAPGPNQPQPLKPGAASARLADALGAVERSAGEKAGGGSG